MWLNWGGKNEKWFWGKNGTQYFILPNGQLYLWNGISLSTSTLVANLNSYYWTDPSLITSA